MKGTRVLSGIAVWKHNRITRIQVTTYSATTNGTGAKAPAAAATPDLRRDGSRDALGRSGRRLAQAAPLEQVMYRLSHVQVGVAKHWKGQRTLLPGTPETRSVPIHTSMARGEALQTGKWAG